MARKMEDDSKYLGRDVVTLSPILDTVDGMVFGYGSFSGEVPPDPENFLGNEDEGAVDTMPTKKGKK